MGGLTREGEDATNELSYMCLQATYDIRLKEPCLSIKVHKESPDALLMKAAELIRTGCGMPQCHNDEVGIRMMLACGTSMEDAYDYDIMGCSEAQVQGKMWKYSGAGQLNMGACMEWALNEGYSRILGDNERWGLPTGDPTSSTPMKSSKKLLRNRLPT